MKTLVLVLAVMIVSTILVGCGDEGNDSGLVQVPQESQKPVPTKSEPITVTIGNLTDLTGVAANPMSYIDMSVRDMVNYYNEENLIPGVELELLPYDTQFNSDRFIYGYEWLREKGADLIWNSLPPGVITLQSRADEDKFPVFSATANVQPEALDGSHVFCIAIAPKYEAYTMLDWIANNDPDFPEDRPAKIGGAAWEEAYSNIWFASAREYCEAHPDKYEWVKDYLTDIKFSWETEIHELKDCDYIYVPTPPHAFMKAYRQAGYKAKFLGTELHVAFNGMIDASGLWEEADGTLIILAAGWYNDEDDPTVEMINGLLANNYSDTTITEILTNGAAYRTALRAHMICDIIRETVEQVGAENFSSEALVETAKSWSFTYGDIEDFSNFTETKRFSQNYYAIYEYDVDSSNPRTWEYVVRADPDWIPQVTAP